MALCNTTFCNQFQSCFNGTYCTCRPDIPVSIWLLESDGHTFSFLSSQPHCAMTTLDALPGITFISQIWPFLDALPILLLTLWQLWKKPPHRPGNWNLRTVSMVTCLVRSICVLITLITNVGFNASVSYSYFYIISWLPLLCTLALYSTTFLYVRDVAAGLVKSSQFKAKGSRLSLWTAGTFLALFSLLLIAAFLRNINVFNIVLGVAALIINIYTTRIGYVIAVALHHLAHTLPHVPGGMASGMVRIGADGQPVSRSNTHSPPVAVVGMATFNQHQITPHGGYGQIIGGGSSPPTPTGMLQQRQPTGQVSPSPSPPGAAPTSLKHINIAAGNNGTRGVVTTSFLVSPASVRQLHAPRMLAEEAMALRRRLIAFTVGSALLVLCVLIIELMGVILYFMRALYVRNAVSVFAGITFLTYLWCVLALWVFWPEPRRHDHHGQPSVRYLNDPKAVMVNKGNGNGARDGRAAMFNRRVSGPNHIGSGSASSQYGSQTAAIAAVHLANGHVIGVPGTGTYQPDGGFHPARVNNNNNNGRNGNSKDMGPPRLFITQMDGAHLPQPAAAINGMSNDHMRLQVNMRHVMAGADDDLESSQQLSSLAPAEASALCEAEVSVSAVPESVTTSAGGSDHIHPNTAVTAQRHQMMNNHGAMSSINQSAAFGGSGGGGNGNHGAAQPPLGRAASRGAPLLTVPTRAPSHVHLTNGMDTSHSTYGNGGNGNQYGMLSKRSSGIISTVSEQFTSSINGQALLSISENEPRPELPSSITPLRFRS